MSGRSLVAPIDTISISLAFFPFSVAYRNANIAGLWRLYYTTPDTGRKLKAVNYFNELTPLKESDYEGLVATLESSWLKVNKQVASDISKLAL